MLVNYKKNISEHKSLFLISFLDVRCGAREMETACTSFVQENGANWGRYILLESRGLRGKQDVCRDAAARRRRMSERKTMMQEKQRTGGISRYLEF